MDLQGLQQESKTMKHASYRKADCCYTCAYLRDDGVALNFLFYCGQAGPSKEPDRRDYDSVDRFLDDVRQWERTNGIQAHDICDLYEARA